MGTEDTCDMFSASPTEERSYACELEAGDVTHFGTVERIERFEAGGLERVRVYFTDEPMLSVKATATFHTKGA